MSDARVLQVCIGDPAIEVGTLWLSSAGGRNFSAFQYSAAWLRHPRAFALSPDLPLSSEKWFFHGDPQVAHSSSLPPPLADTIPDAWGRGLLRKARGLSRDPDEFTLLTDVDDGSRLGALRLRESESGTFLAVAQDGAGRVPPLVDLNSLVNDIHRIEAAHPDREVLQRLLGSSASLGGARPKCTVRKPTGDLALAKFTSRFDTHPVEKAEVLALRLAQACGIAVPRAELVFTQNTAVAVLDRFDRDGPRRIPYLSAQSFLGLSSAVGGTYVDFAEQLRRFSGDVPRDLRELFARVSFTILVSNADDHLKNHGLLYRGAGGWRLSPMFDVNPAPERDRRLKTAILDPRDTRASLGVLLEAAEFFDLEQDTARSLVVDQAERIAGLWRDVARRCGMTTREIREYEPAFTHEESAFARSLGRTQASAAGIPESDPRAPAPRKRQRKG